jgi:hypothetical protein
LPRATLSVTRTVPLSGGLLYTYTPPPYVFTWPVAHGEEQGIEGKGDRETGDGREGWREGGREGDKQCTTLRMRSPIHVTQSTAVVGEGLRVTQGRYPTCAGAGRAQASTLIPPAELLVATMKAKVVVGASTERHRPPPKTWVW